MLNDHRLHIGRYAAAGLVGCLMGTLTVGSVALASSATRAASAPVPLVQSWATRLDERATELLSAPKVPATRIGYGAVVKRGDGGMIETAAPAVDVPAPATASATGEEASPYPAVEPAPPAVFRVRSPLADRVGRVATRLIELGHLAPDQWTDSFDETLENAVRAFQVVEGLQPDGKVGDVTRQAMDRSPQQAAAMMQRAAAAMRAQQASIPDTAVLVNLPGQSVTYIEQGRPVFTMRAVVGRPSRKTPLLQDKITSVTINPTWTVPPTVLTEDKLPVLRKKGTTGIKNAVVYLDGAEVATETVNWWAVDPGRVRIVQKPGDDNALGRFRFNLTNGDGIFLHGTNDPRLFSRDLRAASSGCVRLEDARLMANTLLTAAKLTPASVAQQLDTGETKTVRLPTAVPVRFVSWNASVDTDGVVRVHPDIYEDAPSAPAATPRPVTKPSVLPVPVAHGAPAVVPVSSPVSTSTVRALVPPPSATATAPTATGM
ncbi:L,D-transpeptidase family protein [Azospirillum griseum]|uniref:Murein L,D-transpeptidase n=1 Tax=Azospirillum griseum TaxID=2496639 RepID=A0A431VGV6_9PROT|nr:L,D-transpeptidase family protein [Azospirillum griseum]RTR20123.1 murein L,D-transpeptidase [Azospirillum griseum]